MDVYSQADRATRDLRVAALKELANREIGRLNGLARLNELATTDALVSVGSLYDTIVLLRDLAGRA